MPELEVTPELIKTIGRRLYGDAEAGIHSWKKSMRELLHIGQKRFFQILKGEIPVGPRRVAQIRRLYAILAEQERRNAPR